MEKMRAVGIVSATRAGERKSCMKRNMMTHARMIPTMMFCSKLFIEYSRSSVWSLMTLKSICG